MTSYIYGFHAVKSALENSSMEIICLYVQHGREDQRIQNMLTLARKRNVSIQKISKDDLTQMAGESKHQGILIQVAENQPITYSEAQIPFVLKKLKSPRLVLVLDGIQDPHNLGACLRSADAAGAQLVMIPKDHACEITPLVRKVASGAAEHLHIITVTNVARTLELLKDQGFWIYGFAGEASESLYQTDFSSDCVFVLGSEGSGMRRLTKEKCDFLLHIPMLGTVESLNVSVACGVVLFEVLRQHLQLDKV